MAATKTKPAREVSLPIVFRDPTAIHELGDLVLHAEPVILAGKVVDSAGKGIAGTAVYVHAWMDQPIMLTSLFSHASPHGKALTDAEGLFEIRGTPPQGRMEVSAGTGAYTTVSFPFEPGQFDLTIKLVQKKVVRGVVLLDSEIPPSDLILSTRVNPTSRRDQIKLSKDGTFQFFWDLDEPLELSVLSPHRQEVLLRKSFLTPEGLDRAWELPPLDLRAKISAVKVRFDRKDGRSPGTVAFASAGFGRVASTDEAQIVLYTKQDSLDLEARGFGGVDAQIRGVKSSADFHFEAGIPIEIRFQEEQGLPQNIRVIAEITLLTPTIKQKDFEGGWSYPIGSPKNMEVPIPGDYSVQLLFGGSYGKSASRKKMMAAFAPAPEEDHDSPFLRTINVTRKNGLQVFAFKVTLKERARMEQLAATMAEARASEQ